MKKRTKKKLGKLLFSLLLLLILAATGYLYSEGYLPLPGTDTTAPPPALPVDGVLTVHYIDVGQADCTLLICDGEYLLIDGGENGDGDEVAAYLQELGVTKLDLVVGTHAHSDHIGGLDEVMEIIPAEEVWYPEYRHGTKTEKDFLAAAEAQGIAPVQPELGATYALGDAVVTVLGPVELKYTDVNDTSIVLLVQFGSTRFLFCGDASAPAEEDLLERWGSSYFQADVLKVSHHGSVSSTTTDFLAAIDPEYGVISSGGEYGHPHQETLDKLGDAEILIFRTDLLGSIVISSDGTEISQPTWENTDKEPYIP